MKKKLPGKIRKPRQITLGTREIKVSRRESNKSDQPEMNNIVDPNLALDQSNLDMLDSQANIGI